MVSLLSFLTGARRQEKSKDETIVSYQGGIERRLTIDELTDAYDRYADAIFRHCYFRTLDRDLAKDFVQKTFMEAWKHMDVDNGSMDIRLFLYRVATNLTADATVSAGAFVLSENDKNSSSETQALLALSTIEEPYRTTVTLHIEGFDSTEIAEVTGNDMKVITMRLHHGLEQLNIALQQEKKHLDFFAAECPLSSRFAIKKLPLSV